MCVCVCVCVCFICSLLDLIQDWLYCHKEYKISGSVIVPGNSLILHVFVCKHIALIRTCIKHLKSMWYYKPIRVLKMYITTANLALKTWCLLCFFLRGLNVRLGCFVVVSIERRCM